MKTTEQMIQELYTVILGVPNTSDNGMAGKISQIEDQLRKLNSNVQINTSWRKALCWAVGILSSFCGIFAVIYFS